MKRTSRLWMPWLRRQCATTCRPLLPSLRILGRASGLICGNQSITSRERSSRNEISESHTVQSIITKNTPTRTHSSHDNFTTLRCTHITVFTYSPHIVYTLIHTYFTFFTHQTTILKSIRSTPCTHKQF
jgi:hypothetical protein